MKERDLIEAISSMADSEENDALLCGIGDDCAVVRKNEEQVMLYTMDTLIESVHFDTRWHPPKLLGRKAVSVNVSDIAAMGGAPRYVLFSLGLPQKFDEEWAEELCQGVAEGCKQYDCVLIGGDTVCSPQGVSLTLTAVGEAESRQVLYRHGARAGDIVFVSGPLGLAAGGLALCKQERADREEFKQLVKAHLDPVARVQLGRVLGASGLVHAMMDLSDGIATDLALICARSGLGAHIFQEQLPHDATLDKAAEKLHQDSLEWMIGGGEDYELLFTAPPVAVMELQDVAAACGHVVYPVGKMIDGNGVQLVAEDRGDTTCIDYLGFDHFMTAT